MLLRPILWGLSLSLALAGPVFSGELKLGPKAVLELFTSQGCSSCPKADAMLDEMSKSPDVVVLAYHVDYWDYIGWEDTFGSPENSQRQRDYADAWGSSTSEPRRGNQVRRSRPPGIDEPVSPS